MYETMHVKPKRGTLEIYQMLLYLLQKTQYPHYISVLLLTANMSPVKIFKLYEASWQIVPGS